MSTNKPLQFRFSLVLMLVCYAVVHLLFFSLPEIFDIWEAKAIDRLFVGRSGSAGFQPDYNDTIVHIDLNNTSIQQLQTYFPDRSYHARVIANLSTMGVSAQLFDYIFAARHSAIEDNALMQAAGAAGNVYFGMAFELDHKSQAQKTTPEMSENVRQYLEDTSWKIALSGENTNMFTGSNPLLTFPELTTVSAGTGFLNLTADGDGTFRRVPLLVRYEDAYYPSLAFRIVCEFLKVSPENIHMQPGDTATLMSATIPGRTRTEDIHIPIDISGSMIVNFLGPWERMTHYNYVDVLHASDDRDEMEMWQEELSGKIAVISEVTTGSADISPVPTDTHYPLSGIHANVMHTILNGSFIRELPAWSTFTVECVLMALILSCATFFSPAFFILSTAGIAVVYIFSWASSFLYLGLILDVVRPLFIIFFSIAAITAFRYIKEEKEKALLKSSFEAYFPPSVVRRLIANPGLITSGGQKKELTILFSDIIGFTRHTSRMDPADIQEILNQYFKEMTEIVFRHKGTVDKFIGDGMLAFFGDPEPQVDHALRCVSAARDMQKKIRETADTWKKLAGTPIRIRIGIHTGTVIVGNMGSPKRLSYTVIGSAVNLAQRLESNAPDGGILISHATRDQIKNAVDLQPQGEIMVKGFDQPITVYTVPVK